MSEVYFSLGLADLILSSRMLDSSNSSAAVCDLRKIMSTIKLVLHDAESKQDIPHAARLWLEKLQSSLHRTEVISDGMEVRTLFFPAKAFTLYYAIKRIEKELDDLKSLMFSIDVPPNYGENVATIRTRETYSFIPEKEVIGRDNDKDQIIQKLLDSSDIPVIAIVGLGGLGKTTLAQFVFNDVKITRYFDRLLWVSVSEVSESDWRGFLTKIIASVTANHRSGYEPNHLGILPSENLQQILFKEIQDILFLLVLDDLSLAQGPDYLWPRINLLLDKGARGSKILVTTRSEHIATTIGAIPHYLKGLSEDNCWSLFERLAFEPGQQISKPEFVKLGKDIVPKCGNVPLIIRLVANLLYKKDRKEWLRFRDENVDIMNLFSHDKKDNFLKVLRPSFDELPYPLKLCFAYCSLFPRNFEFNIDDLVQLWMAQGFMESLHPKENQSLEDIGNDCFMELLGKSFFQDVKTNVLGDIISCKMHDMVHHLAQLIAGGSVITSLNSLKFDVKALHLSIIFDGSFPQALFRAHRVRTLLLLKESNCRGKLDRSMCRMLISKFKHLRSLDLHDCGIDILPSNVGDLIHLRYLDLSKNDALVKLPKSITNLLFLQTMKLNFCQNLQRLPKDIGKLMRLRCLEIDECDSLTCMPLGLMKLTCLHSLNRFVVCEPTFYDNSGGLRVFSTLDNLRGRLRIEFSGKWTSVVHEAPEVNLTSKSKLRDLKIEWRLRGLDSERAYYYYGALLEGLQPPWSLQVLCIEGYRGKDFPSWARMDTLASKLPNLVIVSMEGCRECKSLPPFGQLQYLKCLTLRYMEEVQHVEHGAYDPSSPPAIFFPALEELTFHSFRNLRGWWKELRGMHPQAKLLSFPRLSKLKIWNCPNLTLMPLFPGVEEINFQNVNQKLLDVPTTNAASTSTSTELVSSPSFSSTPTTLNHCSSISRVHSHREFSNNWLQDLYNLKHLHIKACLSLKIFPKIGGGDMSSVQSLVIDKCDALTSLAEGLQHLTALEELEFSHCKELNFEDSNNCITSTLSSLTKLRYLTFRGLPKLHALPKGLSEIKNLKFLWIATCGNLTELPHWLDSISSLQHLRIEACPMLTQFPCTMCGLKNLVKLEVMECPNLMERCREPKGQDWPNIKHIPRVVLHKSWRHNLMNDADTTLVPNRNLNS